MQSMPVMYDLVVVGAGLTGAVLAYQLAEAGREVLVVEARDEIGGLSVHGCGLALLGLPGPYAALQEARGAEAAQRIWALTRRNLELLKATAADLGVAVQRVGSFRPVGTGADAEVLERSHALLKEAGFDVELDDATEIGMLIGLRTQEDVLFEPASLIAALLGHPRVTLRTGMEVQALKDDGHHVDVWTRQYYLRAEKVVLAAGPHLVHLEPAMREVIVSAALNLVHCEAAGELVEPWVLDEGHTLLCRYGGQWRMGVCSRKPGEDPWETLLRMNERFLPDARVVKRHMGWIGRSLDGLPVVGQAPTFSSVYLVGGLGAWGASWVFVGAESLCAFLEGEETPEILQLNRFVSS
ncbi:MAG: NAD(P)/FAD-dependent oxidoreductase [Anaerolineae bacterium]